VQQALKGLEGGHVEILYPDELRTKHDLETWRLCYKKIDLLNKGVLAEVKGKAGVYALFVAENGRDWTLKYIGQSKGALTRQRIRSHIVWRNNDTPSGK
jgi:hypothetical protein